MTGQGGSVVGKGLGTGLTDAFAGMRIARQDVQQGKQPMEDPRLMQIYGSLGMPTPPAALQGLDRGPTA